MRTIKFRAWDGESVMYIPAGHEIDANGELKPIGGTIYMQFTGLTDKNGVEIYEGDVMSTPTHKVSKGEIIWFEKWGRWMLKSYNHVERKAFFSGAGAFKNREVIGNIYENPDLLQNKAD